MEKKLALRQKNMLHQLTRLAYDSRKGYLYAVENIFNPTLKEIFLDYSSQRTAFSVELKKVAGNPGPFTIQGSYAGFVHRQWMNMRTLVARNESLGIINECIIAEKYFLKKIMKAEKLGFPENLNKLLSLQKREIVQSIALLNATLEFLPSGQLSGTTQL